MQEITKRLVKEILVREYQFKRSMVDLVHELTDPLVLICGKKPTKIDRADPKLTKKIVDLIC